ncbi:MAG: ABC transporter substrate-binding protein [Xanthobacteraceae bacterium]
MIPLLSCVGIAAVTLASPFVGHAQQPAMPVIGFLDPASPDPALAERLRAFRQGLREFGFVEGENVAVEYRWAENNIDRMDAIAATFAQRRVAVIVAMGGSAPAFAAKKASGAIPVVFAAAQDPVRLGLVANLARPGGNLTGFVLPPEATARRLGLLRELIPSAKRITVLLDPANARDVASTVRDVEAAARPSGLQIKTVNASSAREVDDAFAGFAGERPDALFVGPFSPERRVQLSLLAAVHKIPASYPWRDFVEAGGLMSYGPNLKDAYRQAGAYAGRILKGAKPGDMPIMQTSKFELVLNAVTVRLLGLTVPVSVRSLADETLE